MQAAAADEAPGSDRVANDDSLIYTGRHCLNREAYLLDRAMEPVRSRHSLTVVASRALLFALDTGVDLRGERWASVRRKAASTALVR